MARGIGIASAGQRDRVLTIQQRTDAVDSEGFPAPTWTTLVADMPAAKVPLDTEERFKADQVTARFDSVWDVNYRMDLDPDLVDVPRNRRVVFNGRTLDIVHAEHLGRREGIRIWTIGASTV